MPTSRSSALRGRGPLPARVYWTRRLLVALVAVALVAGIARLLGAGLAGGPGGEDQAAAVAARPATADGRTGTPATTPSPDGGPSPTAEPRKSKPRKPPLPRPAGPCLDSDVVLTPVARDAHAGRRVEVVLEVTTVEAKACTWKVTPDSVFLRIASDEATLWSSQHCPAAVPTESVVARRNHPARVTVAWNGRESAAGCPATTPWVVPGDYALTAAARGSVHVVDGELQLQDAVRPTVTASPTPTSTPSGRG